MKRNIMVILMITSILLCMGCSKKGKEQEQPDVSTHTKNVDVLADLPEDYLYIPFNNFNYSIYNDFTSTRFFTFPLIATSVVDEKNTSIDLGIKSQYSYTIEEVTSEEFPYYLYQCYKGTDWDRMLELYRKDDKKEYNEYKNQYEEEFEKLDISKLENLHFYRVTVGLILNESKMENQEITKVTVTSNGKSYECDLGSIKIDYSSTELFREEGISCDTIALSDIRLSPSTEGIVKIPNVNLTTSKDIILKNVKLYDGEDASIDSVSLDITSKKVNMNREYECGQTMEISANSNVSMAVTIKDTRLANQLDYAFLNYIVIEYEVEGKTYQQKIDISAAVERSYFEYVCEDIDKINMSDYYFKYLSNVDYDYSMIEGIE